MINKLRTKFVVTIVVMVGIVLVLTLAIVLTINYNINNRRVNEMLTSEINNTIDSQITRTQPKIGRPDDIPCVVFALKDGTLYNYQSNDIPTELLKNISPILVNAKYGYGNIPQYGLVYEKVYNGTYSLIAVADDVATKECFDILAVFLPLIVLALGVILIISIFISKWAVRPIEENLEQQKHFIANVSHDLKTPITVMMANNSILSKDANKKQKQWIESNQNEANKMLKLVNSMLDLIKSGVKGGKREKLNLSEIVEAESLSFESLAYDQKITYNTHIEKDIRIAAIKEDIVKLIASLIDNAFKHAANEDIITITLKGNKFTVNNKKTHINKEDLNHIFDRFYIADKSRSNKSHGLGLAIAYELANKNKAKLSATSSKSDGTTFTIVF